MTTPPSTRWFWQPLYSWLLLPLGLAVLWLASRWNPKLRRSLEGRVGLWSRLEEQAAARDPARPLVWFHVASAGELLQALPVLERLLAEGAQGALTVTSASGHRWALENRERLERLIVAGYLPADTRRNMRRLLALLRPSALVYLKYDLWPNLVWEAERQGTPQFLLSAILNENSRRGASAIGRAFYRSLYRAMEGIYPVSEAVLERYRNLAENHPGIEVLGDSRFDAVLERRRVLPPVSLPSFTASGPLFVAGSIWPADEVCILPVLAEALERFPGLTLVLAPHEIEENHPRELEAFFSGQPVMRFSRLEAASGTSGNAAFRVLVVDTVGQLAAFYALPSVATVAYVGGAFRGALHNVLEPAAEGVPVIFGPSFGNDPQAGELIAAGGGFSIPGAIEFGEVLNRLLDDPSYRGKAGEAAAAFVQARAGTAERACERIRRALPTLPPSPSDPT